MRITERLPSQQNSFMMVFVLILPVLSSGVELEPTFDVPMINVTVKEGDTGVLPCSVKFLGQHQVVWTDQLSTLLTYEDRRIIDDERLSIERPYTKDWNLHIRSVRYRDQGIYSCQINTSPVKIKTINLNVIVPAKIISDLSSEDMAVREGETVTLICNVTGIPMPKVTWLRHKQTEDSIVKESEFCPGTNQIGISGEVLLIHNVSRYCGGTYECVAFNGAPPAVSKLIRISVEFAPEIRLPNKRMGQDINKETILECYISAYPHEISVWKRNNQDIQESSKYRREIYQEGEHTITLSLRISNLQEDDFGTYTCWSSNSVGSDSESMVLYDYSAYRKSKSTTTTPIPTTTVSQLTASTPRSLWNRTATQKTSRAGDHRKQLVSIVTKNPAVGPGQRSRPVQGNRGQPFHSKTVQGHSHRNFCSIYVLLYCLFSAWFHR